MEIQLIWRFGNFNQNFVKTFVDSRQFAMIMHSGNRSSRVWCLNNSINHGLTKSNPMPCLGIGPIGSVLGSSWSGNAENLKEILINCPFCCSFNWKLSTLKPKQATFVNDLRAYFNNFTPSAWGGDADSFVSVGAHRLNTTLIQPNPLIGLKKSTHCNL